VSWTSSNAGASSVPQVSGRIDVQRVAIRSGDSLRRGVLPTAWRAANFIRITSTNVDAIDFVNLKAVNTLIVASNGLLTNVTLGALSTAAYLEVRDNLALSPTAFDGVSTHIDDNAPAP
jgi:hypothetical protein